jgi:hypothetical protein
MRTLSLTYLLALTAAADAALGKAVAIDNPANPVKTSRRIKDVMG